MTHVGVIGLGGMGSVHGNKYKAMPDVTMLAYDANPAKREAYAQRFGAQTCDSLDELLARVDLVDVCVPNDLHRDVALQTLAAGKPTVLEKPLARTVAECRELLEASAKSGAALMPAHVVRFFPEYEAAHNLVVGGGVGTPATVRMRRGGKAPQGQDGWFRDLSRSGGVILDLAIHDFDWLLWTIGPVKTVYARSAKLSPNPVAAEFVGDYALILLEHENGCISHVEATWMDPSGFRTTLEVCGSGGMVEYDSRTNAPLRLHTETGTVNENGLLPSEDPYMRELRHFVEHVRDGAALPVQALEAAQAVAVAEAALLSARTLEPVSPEVV